MAPLPGPLPASGAGFSHILLAAGEREDMHWDRQPRAAVARDRCHTLPGPGLPSLALKGTKHYLSGFPNPRVEH